MGERLPAPREFRPQLDSLRAMAVIGVILSHTSPDYTFLQYVRPGDRGVQLFFVLSGFLISGILFDVVKDRGAAALMPFFVRRALRLLPVFYLVLLVTVIVGWDHLQHSWHYHAFYLSNFRFLSTGAWEPLTAHFWSLAQEEQFYLVWPLALVVLPVRYWWIAIAGLFAFGLGTRGLIEITGRWQEFGPGLYPTYYADDFAGGAAIALWLRSSPPVKMVRWFALAVSIIGVVTLVLLCVFFGPGRAAGSTLDVTAWMLISVGLILTCYVGINGRVGGWLESWPLTMMGKISYGVYLWHLLAIVVAKKLTIASGLDPALGQYYWIPNFFGTIIISVVLAGLSWHLVESRLLTFKYKFPYRSSSTDS